MCTQVPLISGGSVFQHEGQVRLGHSLSRCPREGFQASLQGQTLLEATKQGQLIDNDGVQAHGPVLAKSLVGI
jgi:hypothetical protein